jgi:hypothetical protein
MIPVFIPYVNRLDLLERLLTVLRQAKYAVPVILNNSGCRLMFEDIVLYPTVPLTFTQTQNWMLLIAKERAIPFYLWCHCDAIPEPDSVDRLYQRAVEEEEKGTKWGVIYTYYDILCAYNTEAMDAIGGYDTMFFDYASDCDVYRRMDLAGYQRLESGIRVGHDQGSQTIRSDPEQNRRVGLQVEYRTKLYRSMWGGDPGSERFTKKWGGQ